MNLADADHAPFAEQLTEAADRGRGLSVTPEIGKLAVFFTRLADGSVDGASWHGGARVTAEARSDGKWILQFFKEVPAGSRHGEALACFCEARRKIPDFTLHGVRHSVVQPGKAATQVVGGKGTA